MLDFSPINRKSTTAGGHGTCGADGLIPVTRRYEGCLARLELAGAACREQAAAAPSSCGIWFAAEGPAALCAIRRSGAAEAADRGWELRHCVHPGSAGREEIEQTC